MPENLNSGKPRFNLSYFFSNENHDESFFMAEIINNISEIVYLYDFKTQLPFFFNKTLKTVLGYSAEEMNEMFRKKEGFIVYPEDREFVKTHFEAMKKLSPGEKKKFIIRVKDATGKWKWLECVETILASSEYVHKLFVLGMARDITDHVETTMHTVETGDQEIKKDYRCMKCNKLLGVENFKAASFDIKCLRCGVINSLFTDYDRQVFLTDKNGVILYMNEQVQKTTGYSFKEAAGKTPSLWGKQMPDKFYKNLWNDILVQKKSVSVHMLNKKKSGELYPVINRISPLLNEKGDVEFFLCVQTVLEPDQDRTKSAQRRS